MSSTYSIGDKLDVTIDRIVPRGYGIAFVEGLTVFVSLAAAGDRVVVELKRIKDKTAFADIVEIIDPSSTRVAPKCEYFGKCGGCDFQQMSYSEQLRSKVSIIRDCLERIGKTQFLKEIEVVPSPAEFGYRSRAQWHIDGNSKLIGYFARDSRDLVPIEHCPILVSELNRELARQNRSFSWNLIPNQTTFIDAAAGRSGKVSLHSPGIYEPEEISFKVLDQEFKYKAGIFFQGNQGLVPDLIEIALEGATGLHALDLYCGVGLFSLPLARRFTKVTGVEESSASVKFAENNALTNGIRNIDFIRSGVRQFLSNGIDGIDFVLLDPPRAGTERETINAVISLGAAFVSYVACEPSVLARDLKRFADGGYKIDSITAVDLFPQTHHVETVVRLSR